MSTRSYVQAIVLAASLTCSPAGAADVFMCEQAARFGFADSLCEKASSGQDADEQRRKSNSDAWGAQGDGAAGAYASGAGSGYWRFERRKPWEHKHGWNSLEAFYPYTGRFDHDWFQLRLPHSPRQAAPAPTRTGIPGRPPKRPI